MAGSRPAMSVLGWTRSWCDLTPAPGVHVGYGVTLPPAAVGVFSLENIKLSAGLDLPLLTAQTPLPGQFRLLIREYEYVSANWAIVHAGGEALPPWSEAPGRLIYAETIAVDATLLGLP